MFRELMKRIKRKAFTVLDWFRRRYGKPTMQTADMVKYVLKNDQQARECLNNSTFWTIIRKTEVYYKTQLYEVTYIPLDLKEVCEIKTITCNILYNHLCDDDTYTLFTDAEIDHLINTNPDFSLFVAARIYEMSNKTILNIVKKFYMERRM